MEDRRGRPPSKATVEGHGGEAGGEAGLTRRRLSAIAGGNEEDSLAAPAHVAILMGTRNGARFLRGQLASIAAQSHRDWRLVVSDDGSTDETRAILAGFAAEVGPGRVEIREGPRRGFAANFLSLAGDPAIHADFHAFADQDDLWLPGRLARGLALIGAVPPGRPALAGGRTRLVDEAGAPLGLSPEFRLPPSFENALVQSIAGGNTMLFDARAKRLFEAVPDVEVVAHDWWAYQLVSGAGGAVVYDPEPFVLYRQHAGNLIGKNQGVRAQGRRLRLLLAGQMAEWTDVNLAALDRAAALLTPEARAKTALLRRARGGGVLSRLRHLRRLAPYRQTRAGTATLWLAGAARLL
jgi:glycosyltransferase involved in cell wall biosynthesis